VAPSTTGVNGGAGGTTNGENIQNLFPGKIEGKKLTKIRAITTSGASSYFIEIFVFRYISGTRQSSYNGAGHIRQINHSQPI